jgi:hypothetical protein
MGLREAVTLFRSGKAFTHALVFRTQLLSLFPVDAAADYLEVELYGHCIPQPLQCQPAPLPYRRLLCSACTAVFRLVAVFSHLGHFH